MNKPQILFVDDEPHLLSGLRRTLWKQKEAWDMHWAPGGREAIACLASEPIDILVTDMRMPGTDGSALLAHARQFHPAVARIVLSGHADHDMIIESAGPTQQFLSKPCEPELLLQTLVSAVATLDLMQPEGLRALLGSQVSLPKPPRISAELTALIGDPETSVVAVARLMEHDVATSTELLKLVNSSFFGLASQVTTIERAITLLGLDVINALVLAGHLFRPSTDLPAGLDARELSDRGIRACLSVRRIGAAERWDATSVAQIGLAALLYDVALLVLAAEDTRAWTTYRQDRSSGPARERELSAFGCTIGRASSYLLGLWGFHQTVISTLAEQPVDLHDALARLGASPAGLAVAFARCDADERSRLPASLTAQEGSYLTVERADVWQSLTS